MRRFQCILLTTVLLMVLGVTAKAELKLFDNMEAPFDGGTVDGRTPVGVLGGIWDTYPANSTQGGVEASRNDSRVLGVLPSSSGARGCIFNGVSDPIAEGEKGVMFFRFSIDTNRVASVGTVMGLHTITGTAPSYNINNFKAGFRAFNNSTVATDPYNITTINGGTVLKSGLTRNTWYNAWIVVDNAADTFDLYLSEATGPAGAPGLPSGSDKVGTALPFNSATTAPLAGGIFYGLTTTVGGPQTPTAYVDEIWWDGSNPLQTKQAHTPVPANGANKMPVEQVLSWSAPDDPNVVETTGYKIYFDPNEAKVAAGDASTIVVANQSGLSFDPYGAGNLAFMTTYYWRVDVTSKMDTNETVITNGPVWSFTTASEYLPPVIGNFSSVITTTEILPVILSTTISGNSDPLTSVTMTLLTDDMEFPAGANAVLTPNTSNPAAPTASFTTDKAGKYKIKLSVSDGTTNLQAFAEVMVYDDACAAKKASPSGWTANYYDRDGNCVVDLNDFATFAIAWLNDTGMKASESYAASVTYVPQATYDARTEIETYDINNPDPNSVSNYPITDTTGIRISGGVLGYTSVGAFIEYPITIPAAGKYDVYIRSSAANNGGILNYGTQATPNLYGSTTAYTAKGWDNYTTQKYSGALTFTDPLPTKIRITWAGQIMNLDWFIIVQP